MLKEGLGLPFFSSLRNFAAYDHGFERFRRKLCLDIDTVQQFVKKTKNLSSFPMPVTIKFEIAQVCHNQAPHRQILKFVTGVVVPGEILAIMGPSGSWKTSLLRVGLLFYICIFWSTSSIYAALYNFPLEQLYLAKERATNMYRLSAYYNSSTLCDMPVQLAYPTIFMTIFYFMTGFHHTAITFFFTLLAVYLIILTGQGVGEFFGAAILDIKKAGTAVSLILIFLLTRGYYVQNVPIFMTWMKYTSFVHYGFQLLLKLQYSSS